MDSTGRRERLINRAAKSTRNQALCGALFYSVPRRFIPNDLFRDSPRANDERVRRDSADVVVSRFYDAISPLDAPAGPRSSRPYLRQSARETRSISLNILQ